MVKYDLLVVGAGSGGISAAEFAKKFGKNVALVEGNRIGGDCTWTGCVPSKAIIHASKVAHEARNAAHVGVDVGEVKVSMTRVKKYVQDKIHQVWQEENEDKMRDKGIDVFMGHASFVNEYSMVVKMADGSEDVTIEARNILLCTGARPFIPDLPGLDEVRYWTYENIFEMDYLPRHLVVLGSGPIGAELAQTISRLGSKVTVIGNGVLPRDEKEVSQVLTDVFEEEGIEVVRGRAQTINNLKGGEDTFEVVVSTGERIRGTDLLVSVGRIPNVDGINASAIGLEVNYPGKSKGKPGFVTQKGGRTNLKHIYAAGDCVGGPQFTHYAGWQSVMCVRNMLWPGTMPVESNVVPWTTYTDPEVGHVGHTEESAREKYGAEALTATWDMSKTDRAICENTEQHGFIKIVYLKKNLRIVGATIVCARAGELISEFCVAVRLKLTMKDIGQTIHPYPTYAMAIWQLCSEVVRDNIASSKTAQFFLKK